MKTLRLIIVIVIVGICSKQGLAQRYGKGPGSPGSPPQQEDSTRREQRKQKVEALRIAYITKELDLSETEAQTFWPVYNEYQKKQDELRKEFRKKYNKQTNYNFATDKEAEDFVSAEVQMKTQEADLMKTYYDKLKKVLPIKKVAKLRHAEESFRQELLKQVKHHMDH